MSTIRKGDRGRGAMIEDEAQRTQTVDALEAAGFNELGIMRLVEVREQVRSGERSELTRAHKYLLFLKYLREADRLDEG
jgi:hypothetical protein